MHPIAEGAAAVFDVSDGEVAARFGQGEAHLCACAAHGGGQPIGAADGHLGWRQVDGHHVRGAGACAVRGHGCGVVQPHDGGADGVVALELRDGAVVPRPGGAAGRGKAGADHLVGAVDDLHQHTLGRAIEGRRQAARVGQRLVVGDEVGGAGACVGADGADGDGRDGVDRHVHVHQHLGAGGAVVIDLVDVGYAVHGIARRDTEGALVSPSARQIGVAQQAGRGTVGADHAVVGQHAQVEHVVQLAVDHELHLAGAGGAAGGLHAAVGRLHGAGEGVRSHGGGIAAAQAEHVVGRHGQLGGAALQGDHLHLLDGPDGLVAGGGLQVERGACGELEVVDARAAVDDAACSQCGLQAGVAHGDGVVAAQRVQCACGVAQGVGVGGGAGCAEGIGG